MRRVIVELTQTSMDCETLSYLGACLVLILQPLQKFWPSLWRKVLDESGESPERAFLPGGQWGSFSGSKQIYFRFASRIHDVPVASTCL